MVGETLKMWKHRIAIAQRLSIIINKGINVHQKYLYLKLDGYKILITICNGFNGWVRVKIESDNIRNQIFL